MKDRIFVWFMLPLIVIITILTDMLFNYEITTLNQMVIDFIPYPHNNITCLGCCTLECLENALIKTLHLKILLPFFSVAMMTLFSIVIGIMSYLEIKEEKRGRDN